MTVCTMILIYNSKVKIKDISKTYTYWIELYCLFLVQSSSSFTRKRKGCAVNLHYILFNDKRL